MKRFDRLMTASLMTLGLGLGLAGCSTEDASKPADVPADKGKMSGGMDADKGKMSGGMDADKGKMEGAPK